MEECTHFVMWFLLSSGEWEQALSRKDKKNRKKDDPLAADDTVVENIGNTDFFTIFKIFISISWLFKSSQSTGKCDSTF